MLISGAQALSEDFTRFRGFIIGCGEASALVVDHIVKGTPLSYQMLSQLINDASNSGHLDYGLGQTAGAVQWDLQHVAGEGSSVTYGPGRNLANIISNALKANKPVLLGVNNGAMLSGETPNVRGHYVAVVGVNNDGSYIVADPNTSASASGGFVNDTLQQLQNANPFAAIIPNDAAKGGTGNPISNVPILGGITDIPSGLAAIADSLSPANIAQGIGQGISTTFGNLIKAPFAGIGINNLSDFMWRSALITLGLILLIAGLIALFHEQISDQYNGMQDRAASAAAMAA